MRNARGGTGEARLLRSRLSEPFSICPVEAKRECCRQLGAPMATRNMMMKGRQTHLSPHELHNVFGPIGPCQVPMEDVISLPGNEDEERLAKKRDRD